MMPTSSFVLSDLLSVEMSDSLEQERGLLSDLARILHSAVLDGVFRAKQRRRRTGQLLQCRQPRHPGLLLRPKDPC